VGKIEEGDTGVLTLTVVQDVFGLPSTSYSSGQQGSSWTPRIKPPDLSAFSASSSFLRCAGRDAQRGGAELPKPESGYPGIMAVAPTTLSINYQIQTRAAGEILLIGNGDWTPSGLTAAVGPLDTVLHVNMTRFPSVGDGLLSMMKSSGSMPLTSLPGH
jgi:hypothetical protein